MRMSRPRLVALLLALLTLVIYLPATRHGFSRFDDSDYVTENQVVQNGLTWAGVKWAFVTWHAGNWHPLTWLSHMLDCELFGLNAGAHHFINVLLHALNAVLLFALLRRLTGMLWPAAFIAALFAWHPLRVESVAWIAERKDVLSTLFALLTLTSYAKYVELSKVQSPKSKVHFGLGLLFFALGLLAKPMLVTLPFVMLLLDYWPLQRVAGCRLPVAGPRDPLFQAATGNWQLVTEKIPFLVLTGASCVVTFLAQHRGGLVVPLDELPLAHRLANVPLGYLHCLQKIVWPVHLAFLYPLPKTFSALGVVMAVAALSLITVVLWLGRKRSPYGFTGWLWFLGTLVPVIGLVQVGRTALSDRYSYFPSVGISIVVVFAIHDWLRRFQIRGIFPVVGAVLVLGGCVVLTEKQLDCWQDDVTLFAHAVNVTRDNEAAHLCLGLSLEAVGRKSEALKEYRIGLKLNPYRVKTYDYIADVLADTGQTNQAMETLQEGLRVNFNDGPTHDRLARLWSSFGRPDDALYEFQTALKINPKDTVALNDRGMLLVTLGRFDEAMTNYAEAARLDPGNWHSPFLTGLALLKQNRDPEAIPFFWQALQKNPNDVQLLVYLAQVLASDENSKVRDGRAAFNLASKAAALAGGDEPTVLDALAMACAEVGRFDDAQKAAQDAVRLNTANGQTNDAILVQQRLQLYQSHQPFRQSYAGASAGETPKR